MFLLAGEHSVKQMFQKTQHFASSYRQGPGNILAAMVDTTRSVCETRGQTPKYEYHDSRVFEYLSRIFSTHQTGRQLSRVPSLKA